MAENILADHNVRIPDWSRAAVCIFSLATGVLLSTVFVIATGPLVALAGSVLAAAAPLLFASLLFAETRAFVSPAAPLLVAAILFVLFAIVRFAVSRQQAYAWYKRMENARQVTIESMAAVAETRDPETGAHIKRTQHYVRAIAEELRRSGHHLTVLTPEYIDLLFLRRAA